jgi:hypothetical protein
MVSGFERMIGSSDMTPIAAIQQFETRRPIYA